MSQHIQQLRRVLLISTLLLISTVVFITAYSLWRFKLDTRSNMLDISAMHSHTFETFITQNIRLAELATINIANMDTRKKNRFAIERSFVNALKNNPAQRSIALLDENNRIIVSSNPANVGLTINTDTFLPLPVGKSVLRIGRPWSGRDFISGAEISPDVPINGAQLSFIPVIHTLVLTNRTFTILTAFNPDFFINHISQTLSLKVGAVDVLREDGTLLFSSDPAQNVGEKHHHRRQHYNTEPAISGEYIEADYPDHTLTTYHTSNLYYFKVVTHISHQHARQQWLNKASTLVSVITAMLILLIILAIIFYRRQMQFSSQRRAANRQQQIHSTVFASSADSIIITDLNARIISVNPAFCRITGYSQAEVIGRNPNIISSGQQDARFYKEMWKIIHKNGVWQGEVINRHKDGQLYNMHATITAFRDDDGTLQHFIGVSTDITEHKKSEVRLQQAASVFLNSQEGIMVTDADNYIIDVNPAFSRITGYSYAEVLGKKPSILSSDTQPTGLDDAIKKILAEKGSWQGEIWNRKKSGELFAVRLSIDIARAENGETLQHVAVFSDISRLKIHEEELHRIAHYDPLTGIPNRRLLEDRLSQSIARTKRNGTSLAVCYLDLDGFKPVNDQFGHSVGDLLLIKITERLKKVLRADDTLARLGGDEFVILFSELHKPEELDLVLNRTLTTISTPILIEGHLITISASIGATLFPADAADADTLLRHADQAMYRAKDAGKNRYHLFDPKFDLEVQAIRSKLKYISLGLKNDEFVLYYQPKVNLVSGDIIGAEALIRWQHPEQGLLPPAAFLDLIDGHPLEITLGEWVIESAIKQIAQWNSEGLFFPVSANLSANHLLTPGFSDRLRLMLERHPSVKPQNLELEILETSTLNDLDQATRVLAQCRKMGVQFALDDFGTGYSSLTYFQRLPVDILKIDQSFVRDMLEDPSDLDIVESIIRLAQTFNRPVIAEGVETLGHGAMQIKLGCQQAQGYGIARPMPAKSIPAWCQEWITTTPWLTITPPLDSEDNLSLRVAIQSHIHWIDCLITFLTNPTKTLNPQKLNTYRQFERWFQSSGFARYGDLAEYQEVALLYSALSLFCDELIIVAQNTDITAGSKQRVDLDQQQKQLLDKIQTLIKSADLIKT